MTAQMGIRSLAADEAAHDNPTDASQAPASLQNPVAPRGRFGPARTSLGQFARNGSADEMRRGVGRYVSKGLGGSGMGTRRLGGTVRNAGALYGALSATASGQPSAPGSPLDPALLAGRSANEIMDAVVEAVRPTDGTQDAESARSAIKDALSAVLIQYEDADLLNLSKDQRALAIEQYLSVRPVQSPPAGCWAVDPETEHRPPALHWRASKKSRTTSGRRCRPPFVDSDELAQL